MDKVLNDTKIIRKIKGDDLRLNCNIKKTAIKTEIIWYKNEKVLSEEDYGITRYELLLILYRSGIKAMFMNFTLISY